MWCEGLTVKFGWKKCDLSVKKYLEDKQQPLKALHVLGSAPVYPPGLEGELPPGFGGWVAAGV